MGTNGWRTALFGLTLGVLTTAQGFAKAESTKDDDPAQAVFATVNGDVIHQGSYETALRIAGRQRFYHGKAPEPELIAFRKEIGERLVDEQIMLQEAVRRGFKPDAAWVDKEFERIEARYAASPQWHESGDSLKDQIRSGLERQNLIEQMNDALRTIELPATSEVRAYYAANPDKFTSPEQVRVSSILLKVEPWQPRAVWEQQREVAERVLAEIKGGTAFEDYAEEYPPLPKGQLGYLHRGMLGQGAQDEIDKLQPGEISGVVELLEGMAIFRLDDRVPATLNDFERVKERASALLARELSEAAYQQRLAELRAAATVKYSDPNYYRTPATVTLQDPAHGGAPPAKNE